MAESTPCQTNDAVYGVSISDDTIMCHVELPFVLNLNPDEEVLLRKNLHNAIELVLAKYWIANDILSKPYVEIDPGKEDFMDDFGHYMINVHTKETCSGKCTIHNHSDHALSDKPLLWRNDRGIFEHICEHGIGHPCPDSLLTGDSGVHGCCGCERTNHESKGTKDR
jgi:hypothetical protein